MPNLPMFFDPKDMSRARLLEWFDEALSLTGAGPETPLEGLYAKEALYQYYAASWVERQAKIGAEKGLPRPWETEGEALKFLRFQGDLGEALKARLAPDIINTLTSSSLSEAEAAFMEKLCRRVGAEWPGQEKQPVSPAASPPPWGWSLRLLRYGITASKSAARSARRSFGRPDFDNYQELTLNEAKRILGDLKPVDLNETDAALFREFRDLWDGRKGFIFKMPDEGLPAGRQFQPNRAPEPARDCIRPALPMIFDPKDMSEEQLLEWLDGNLSFLDCDYRNNETRMEEIYIKEIVSHYLAASWIEHQKKTPAEKGQPRPWETEEGGLKLLLSEDRRNGAPLEALKIRLAPVSPGASPPPWGWSLRLLRSSFHGGVFQRHDRDLARRIVTDLLTVDLSQPDAALFKAFCLEMEQRMERPGFCF